MPFTFYSGIIRLSYACYACVRAYACVCVGLCVHKQVCMVHAYSVHTSLPSTYVHVKIKVHSLVSVNCSTQIIQHFPRIPQVPTQHFRILQEGGVWGLGVTVQIAQYM